MTGHASPPAGGARRLAGLLSSSKPLGVKRMIALALFVPGLVLLQLLHRIGFALDHLLFPGYRRVDVCEPLFVVGMPRSGTSFLHQTLSQDTRRFTTLTLWELVLAPSISERAFWAGLAGMDAKLGTPVTRLGRFIERTIAGIMDRVHPVDFEEPGEDFLFLLPLFACFLLVAVFPRSPAIWELVLAPSISERAFWTGLAGIDAKLGAPVTRLGRSIERMIIDSMDGVHPVDFEEPGEDFLFLLPLFACFLLVAVFPRSPAIWELTRIDDWPTERREALLRWYRSCLQRHLYWVQRLSLIHI